MFAPMATVRFRHLCALVALTFALSGVQAQTLTVSISPNAPSVAEGSSLVLTANASTLTGLTVQWSRDGIVLPGETATTLTVDNLRFGDEGAIFSVRVDRASDGAFATDATQPLDVTDNTGTSFVVQSDASRGPGSVLEAVNLTQTSVAAPGLPRVVTFVSGLNGRTIPVAAELLITSDALAIVDATSLPAGIVLSGANARRIFTLDAAGNLELRRVGLVAGNGAGSLASGSGGAIYSQGALRLVGCSIQSSSATTGGALFHQGDPLTLMDCTIRGNTSTGAGGGVVAFGGQITVQNCVFAGNAAQGNSGGLRVAVGGSPATVLVTDSVFTDNTTALSAGGCSLNGVSGSTFDFRRCRFERNEASVAGGGILHFIGDLALNESSFTANTATSGAGVYLQSAGAVTVGQSTFSNNTVSSTAAGSGGGGGLYAFSGTLTVTHCTFAGNTATGTSASGAGLQIQSPTSLTIGNSIVAGNVAAMGRGADLNFTGGTVTVANPCLLGDNDTVETLFPFGPLAGTISDPLDPRLAPVGLYGGTTPTRPPLDLSPALDAATGTSPATDQRGFPRGVGSASDLGAVERGPVVTIASTADSGAGSLRAAIDAAQPDTRLRFDAALNGQTITVTGSALLLAAGRAVEIDASNLAAGIRLFGTNVAHVFDVAAGAGLSLRRVGISARFLVGTEPGVGIRSFGGLRLFECEVGSISANGEASCLYVGAGTAVLESSTFGRGSASGGAGGAIVVDGSDTFASLTNCTVADHLVEGEGRTGGIVARNGSLLSLFHTTISGCSGTAARGLRVESGSEVRIERCLIASDILPEFANTDISNVGGTVTAVGPSLIGVNTTVTGQFPTGPLAGTSAAPLNPLLSALTNNGGFTPTFFPLRGSPAINAAGLSPLDFDQRGQPRGASGNDDLGSVEVGTDDPAFTRLLNVSTRLRAGTGVSAPIVGFAVKGGPKKVAIRALGPTLADFGVPNVMANPTLQLVRSSDGQTLAVNDNWQQDAGSAQELIGANLALPNSAESGIVAILPEGTYTAIVRGVADGTGNCLVEVYDLDLSAGPRLINLSTRGPAGTGDNVMIAGVVVGPGQSKRVLFRALGPTLTAFGVTGALQDPMFEVLAGPTPIGSNDDWQSSQAAEITATGFAPPDAREPALILTLGPGSYTAIVRGKNNTEGNAIIEVYELP